MHGLVKMYVMRWPFVGQHFIRFGTKLYRQGHRRVFKSGPAEEIIECRRHERRESTRGGLSFSSGGLGGLPREQFEFLALLCAFFMRLGPDFRHNFLLEKIFLGA